MKRLTRIFVLSLLMGLVACSSTSGQAPAFISTVLAPPALTAVPGSNQAAAGDGAGVFPDIGKYGLSGRIVTLFYDTSGNRLIELNLANGEVKTLFKAPDHSWLNEVHVSPDHKQILLVYAPPPPDNGPQFGYSDLYLIPYDGSSPPMPFLVREAPQESFFSASWAPDGQSIYYTHLYTLDPSGQNPPFQNDIEKATLDGVRQTLVEHGAWPALSADGGRMAYLYADPNSLGNDLYLANPDGSAQTPLLPKGGSPVDAHLFSMQGDQLYFSMVNPQPAPTTSLLDKLLGVQVASAHFTPSDWYRLPVSGGNPQRITELGDIDLYGAFSQDGGQMAFIGATGLYVMDVDGKHLVHISADPLIGSIDWIP